MKQRQHKFTHDMRPYPRGKVTAEELTTAADKGPEFLVKGNIGIWDWKRHNQLESFIQFGTHNFSKGKVGEEAQEKTKQTNLNLRN